MLAPDQPVDRYPARDTVDDRQKRDADERQAEDPHDQHHLDKAIAAFTKVGKELGVLK